MFSTTFLILFALSIFILGGLAVLDFTKKIKQQRLEKIPIKIDELRE